MRKYLLVIVVLIPLFLGGCNEASIDASGKIVSPKITSSPLQGKWIIEQAYNKDFKQLTQKSDAPFLSSIVEFNKDAVMVGNYFWTNTEYKIKQANADEYFILKYQKSAEKIGIDQKDVIIVTVTSSEKFIYEFVETGSSECLADIEGCIYKLKKTSDKVDPDFDKKVSRENLPESAQNTFKSSKTPISGVFIGLKSQKNANQAVPSYTYRTVFIESINKALKPATQTDNIFFPRKSGFWKLEVMTVTVGGLKEDVIDAYDTSGDVPKITPLHADNNSLWLQRNGYISRSVLSLSNDYISIETKGSGGYNGQAGFWNENHLQLQPIDSMNTNKGITIEDVSGAVGIKSLEEARQNAISLLETNSTNVLDDSYKTENFALTRKTGHWFFKGRLKYIKDSQLLSTDFNINLMPPSKILPYDTLFIPWTSIKDKVPEAVDAYTSPNKDIALIVTAKYIFVYSIENGALSNSCLQKITLNQNESVIMTEWATGDYVYNWERNFNKNVIKQAD